MLSTVSRLARTAERYPEALRYFPEGSTLVLSASGEPGNYAESGYLNVYGELRYPSGNGSIKTSGKEEIYRSSGERGRSIEAAFEEFLKSLGSAELNE
jgi:hypothetical protein